MQDRKKRVKERFYTPKRQLKILLILSYFHKNIKYFTIIINSAKKRTKTLSLKNDQKR